MKPTVKEFQDDTALMEEIKTQSKTGISKDNMYVMSHDNDCTDRVALPPL
ncbi:hypothetical protein GCM10009001_14310 [Virgibacillus siamensis]|uniref:General stress protein 17M-like domain-containing protein n=1 Tax=Virgibacillus siamensis TaxID=480071 RepID=A0ABN1FWC4_9BACI